MRLLRGASLLRLLRGPRLLRLFCRLRIAPVFSLSLLIVLGDCDGCCSEE
jgi:hypothetical protein